MHTACYIACLTISIHLYVCARVCVCVHGLNQTDWVMHKIIE